MRWTKQGIHLNLRTNDVANFQKLYSIIRNKLHNVVNLDFIRMNYIEFENDGFIYRV